MTINSSLKPFVINATDIQFLIDQVNFTPLFDAGGNIIVAWDGNGAVYNFAGVAFEDQGSPAANLAKWGQSYQNFTDLAGTRDVSGYWNNLTPLLSHYGDAGHIFPRMVTADYSGYVVQVTGTVTTGPIILTSLEPVVTTADSNVQVLIDDGIVTVAAPPGVTTKTLHEIISSGTTIMTAIAQTVATTVVDGHHLVATQTTTSTETTTTTTSYDYVRDEVTTTLVTPFATIETVNATVIQTTAADVTTDVVTGAAVTTLTGGELDGSNHTFASIPTDVLAGWAGLSPEDLALAKAAWQTNYALGHQDYTVQGALGGGAEGDTTASDGTAINLLNVVDYTPRMISRTITTAGVTYDTWANHQTMDDGLGGTIANPDAASHTLNEIYYSPETGEAVVLDWGLLDTVANGGEGQVDTQGRLDASAGQDDHFIGGLNPGVSPSNGFFVLFGQFFDHGLDFIDKGQLDANGKNITIKIALAVDDPLYGMIGPDGRPVTEITINRATVQTVDAEGSEYVNHVSPYIDQSQTYGSDVQRTQLLREWVSTDGDVTYHAGMNLFDGQTLATQWAKADGTLTNDTLPTLNELRDHIDATGRDALTWEDVSNLRNRDDDGHVVSGASGEALLLDMNPRFDETHLLTANGESATETGRVMTAIATLNDDLSAAYGPGVSLGMVSGVLTLTGLPGTSGPLTGASALFPWVDFSNFSIMPNHAFAGPISDLVHSAVGDILMASVGDHYIAGDGRVNENFGLTSIHHVFHEEHNFQVQNLIDALHRQDVANPDGHARLHEFQNNTGTMNAAGDFINGDGSIAWNDDKVFQGAKLIVEMEYQHAAVDQYARNVSPNIQEFVGYSPDKQPDVTLEYAQAAFRFGHSTLRETIDTIDPSHGLTGKIMGYALHDAFLNPELFGTTGPGAIILGMTHQQQNEVDEFVTPALNQGLLGQPLDLAAINIARGRDVGIPTLNTFREAIGLVRYTSWNDFSQNMQHPSSLVNFIAAYAFDGSVEKAQAVLDLAGGTFADEAAGLALGDALGWAGTVADMVSQAIGFLSGDETNGGAGTLAFNDIDTWLGGLAEIHQPGGLLGETFDKVFVTQIESLMDGDRFYYLYRLAGQQFGEEVANGQLKDIFERNTGLTHLNGNIFGYVDQYVDLAAQKEVVAPGAEAQTTGDEHKYGDDANVANGTIGIYTNGGLTNANDGNTITVNGRTYVQDTRLSADNPLSADYDPTGQSAYAQNGFTNLDGTPNSGAESSEVIVGSKGDDMIYSQGGDDTDYGEEGDDILAGGFGIDRMYGGQGGDTMYGGDNPDLMDGGAGDDLIYGESSGSDINGMDQIIGGFGNDTIFGGTGIDKLSAGAGDDKVYGDSDTDPFTHGGDGDDYVDGGSGGDILYGDNGDDVVVGGSDQDQLFGNDGDDILLPGDPTGALTIGSDEVLGGDGVDVNDMGFDLISFSDNNARPNGVTFDIGNQANPNVTVNGSPAQVPTYQIDGVVGSVSNDKLVGDDESAAGNGADASIAGKNWLIGGSGDDSFQGLGGNDIIVGGSIRLDALIGKYNSGYTHNIDNAGLTDAEQQLDARYQGASHRVDYSETVDNSGLLGHSQTNMFERRFTEMLRSEMFKDTMLGDGGTDGTADTAIYTGTINIDSPNQSDYTVVALNAQGGVVANPHANGFFALKITDNRTANDFIDANGNPIVDANGNPLTNEGTDLVVGVENLQFANGTIKTAALFDKAPTVDLNYVPVANLSVVASDNFSGLPLNNAYGRGTGWNGSWTESNDGINPSTAGQITASTTGGSFLNTGLVFGNGDGASIVRTVSAISGQSQATLSFTYNESGFDSGETVAVRFSADGTNFVTIGTIDGSSGSGTYDYDLTALLGPGQTFAANAKLQFVASTDAGAGEYVRVDNITFSAPNGTFHDGASGNNWSTGYTEGGAAAEVAAAGSTLVTDTDDTLLQSATVQIREGVAGDVLAVGTLPATIVAVVSADHRTVTLTSLALAGAAKTDFESAIEAVTFSNSGLNPTNYGQNLNRHLDVTVNDGLRDSAVATTTVDITAIENPTVLANDSVITNFGTGTNFSISDALLLANDSDPDTLLSITSIGNGVGISTSGNGRGHSGQTVTIRDDSPAGGTFTYTANGSVATVTVAQDTSGALDGTSNADIIIGNSSSSTINGGDGNDTIVGAGGNDTVNAGGGDDTLLWNANNANGNSNNGTDGRDIVDGGANGSATGDTYVINGNGSDETFTVYTRANWLALGGTGNSGHTAVSGTSEIIITRGGTTNSSVIAELQNVEELVINTGSGIDNVNVSGNFNTTHLNYNTIHINDADGGDSVDITGLMSEHRIVFETDATGQVIGDLRPQDVVNGVSQGGSNSQPDGDPSVEDGHFDGSSVEDVLVGSDHHDTLRGMGGDDTVFANKGGDLVRGGTGDDRMMGMAGKDHLHGSSGNDLIFGGNSSDTIAGGADNDTVFGGNGEDLIIARVDDGNDDYYGDAASGPQFSDTLDMSLIGANITADLGTGPLSSGMVVSGQSGIDSIWGIENIVTGSGDDVITASASVNVMDGGAGNDTYRFRSAADANGDTITSFAPGDRIDLSQVDADEGTTGVQGFTLVSGGFSGAIGELSVAFETRTDGEYTVIEGNTSGDTTEEFKVSIKGHHDLALTDFVI